jgi:Fic family protein
MAGATDIVTRSLGQKVLFGEFEAMRDRHLELLGRLSAADRNEFVEKFDMSWIYHDCALEGQVLTPQEIWTALNTQVRSDSAFQPSLADVRNNKRAIEFLRGLADKKKVTIGPEMMRRLHNILDSNGGQGGGSLLYRKDIPIHRTYFHEIIQPSRLPYQMKRFFEWARDPGNRRIHPIQYAASLHYRLMRIFPFSHHSGKISRLLMNLVFIRAGYPPAIIHSTDRQTYYEAIRDGADELLDVVKRALGDTMLSNIAMLER